ncbi:MAG: amino acid ABC transporter substrate-binding protein [Anaerolineae bacterium]|nr:amino acid ABC transporter substrate-binding protein [Anaerolineae bacterium]MCB0176724.1 amino acid ABC transporter substrate-binding protein [Anaerolineae bacterium]MCB9103114.1 amino acid ABC transporter substrate-binding protein [Anaerolineales bacterium]
MKKNVLVSTILLLGLGLFLSACGGSPVVEKVVTVEVEKVVTVEVDKEVEVAAEVEEPAEGAATEEAMAEEPAAEQTTEETAAPAAQAGGDTLGIVKDRGVLNCGGNAAVPGFGYLDPDTNEFAGFDIDFCKAVAAAVLGDSEAIDVRALTGTDRFPVLQAGEVDLLARNTTWTISRDTSLGFNFAPVNFYDGQGMMVRKDSGIETLADLEGATVCVQQGTTTERNLADVMRALDVTYEPVVLADQPATLAAYAEGRCDGFTTDKSGLVSSQTQLPDPDAHVILEETMSKEPLAPVVRHGDDQWFDIVKWVMFGLIEGEELGITSANVEEMAATSEDPVVRNFLGVEGDLGTGLGLDNDFMVTVIGQVGNYGEIYDRNLGPDTVFNLERGQNALWTEGGLMYSMPFR